MWPPNEFQLLSIFSGTPKRIRPDNDQVEWFSTKDIYEQGGSRVCHPPRYRSVDGNGGNKPIFLHLRASSESPTKNTQHGHFMILEPLTTRRGWQLQTA